jgi:hypothetical protein
MSTGIDWVFSQVERAILLEDDCLAEPSFFDYCQELLDRYALESRVMMISGDNFHFGSSQTTDSYYFSRVPHIWGWATWRRAWQRYDVTMSGWPALRESDWLARYLGDDHLARHFLNVFDNIHAGRIDTWDLQWTLAIWSHDGLCIAPDVNLISNIGFGPLATHTRSPRSPHACLPTQPITFPLRHPPTLTPHHAADSLVLTRLVGSGNV